MKKMEILLAKRIKTEKGWKIDRLDKSEQAKFEWAYSVKSGKPFVPAENFSDWTKTSLEDKACKVISKIENINLDYVTLIGIKVGNVCYQTRITEDNLVYGKKSQKIE